MLSYVAEHGGVDVNSYTLANDWMGLGFSLLIVASMHMMREVFVRHRLEAESLRTISEAANDANIVVDDKANVLIWNHAAQKIFGYSPEEARGRKLEELIIAERYRNDFREMLLRPDIEDRETVNNATSELASRRNDGTEIVAEYSISVVKIDGKTHAICLVRDVTARKQVEKRMRERNATLEMLSAKMLTSDEMERKNLAYGLHEDLAQTLVMIKMRVEHFLQEYASSIGQDDLPASIVPLLQGAIKDVESMATALHPSSLDDIGLLKTISWYCREFDRMHPAIQVLEEISVQENDVPERLKIVIYRIIESAFANIVRCEDPDRIAFKLQRDNGTVSLAIDDTSQDTRNVAAKERETDLQARFGEAQERTTLSGGTFEIARGKVGGIKLRATWAV